MVQDDKRYGLRLDRLEPLYRDILLDHYRHPRNEGDIKDPDLSAHGLNPFCGDEVYLQARVSDGNIAQVGLQARGCTISQASGSMMGDAIKGRSLEEALLLYRLLKGLMEGESLGPHDKEKLGDLTALGDVRRYPLRIKCALLPWATLEEGLQEYRKKRG
ncbi:MAG: SUF system NifU family Fe-S cluster assembly protein [Chloroflexi bacterium]|nr:SUF system NifU family Fe-S cluster assembly protein [Chloroflexota bacterium]